MAAPKLEISKLVEREWGRVTSKIEIDTAGISTLIDPNKPVLCWAQFVPNDLAESVDGSEVYCIYEYLAEHRHLDPKTKKQVEIGRTVQLTIYCTNIDQCENMDKAMLGALNATRRVIDYSTSFGAPDEPYDLRGIRREVTILY